MMNKNKAKPLKMNNQELLSSKQVGIKVGTFYRHYSMLKDNETPENLWSLFCDVECEKINVCDVKIEEIGDRNNEYKLKLEKEKKISKSLIEDKDFKDFACDYFNRKLYEDSNAGKDSTKMNSIVLEGEFFSVAQINSKITFFLYQAIDNKEKWTSEELWVEFIKFNRERMGDEKLDFREKLLSKYWTQESNKDKYKVIALFDKRIEKEKQKKKGGVKLEPIIIDGRNVLTSHKKQMMLSHYWNYAKRNKSYLNELQLTQEFISESKAFLTAMNENLEHLLIFCKFFKENVEFSKCMLKFYHYSSFRHSKVWYWDNQNKCYYMTDYYLERLIKIVKEESIKSVVKMTGIIEFPYDINEEDCYNEWKKIVEIELENQIDKVNKQILIYNYYVLNEKFKKELKVYFKEHLNQKNGQLNESGFLDCKSLYLGHEPLKTISNFTGLKTTYLLEISRDRHLSFKEMKETPYFSYWSTLKELKIK